VTFVIEDITRERPRSQVDAPESLGWFRRNTDWVPYAVRTTIERISAACRLRVRLHVEDAGCKRKRTQPKENRLTHNRRPISEKCEVKMTMN